MSWYLGHYLVIQILSRSVLVWIHTIHTHDSFHSLIEVKVGLSQNILKVLTVMLREQLFEHIEVIFPLLDLLLRESLLSISVLIIVVIN